MSEFVAFAFWSLLAAAGVALSALYAAGETAIYVTNKIRLELQAEMGSKPARLLQKLLSDTNNLLAVLLTGNNLVNYITTFAITSIFTMAGQGDHAQSYTMITATSRRRKRNARRSARAYMPAPAIFPI
jgi:Mg2+/Co2+ transporter CorB